MYFDSRQQAGEMLAQQIAPTYRYENCAVVALNDGGVLVGERIASALHCVLTLIISEEIPIPGEGINFGAISQNGDFSYNSAFSPGEVFEYTSEFHGYLEDKKRETYQRINRLLVDGGTIDAALLQDRVVILTADAIATQTVLDVVLQFLKPVRVAKLIVAVPIVALDVVDKLHLQTDELHILDVRENFISTDHYYEHHDIPSHEEIVHHINQVVLSWQ
jgi:putative phosphoribosyl transferase